MFTAIETYFPTGIETRLVLAPSCGRGRDKGWMHAEIVLAGRLVR